MPGRFRRFCPQCFRIRAKKPGALSLLPPGQVVTVDALWGRVFEGAVPELLALRLSRKLPEADTPALALLRRIVLHILPLHLADPQSELFTPGNCASLRDVMRYVHELSYTKMFLLSDSASENSAGVAGRLHYDVPLDLHVVDLGGLKKPEAPLAGPEDVRSAPFRHLPDGMLNPAVRANGPRAVNMRGFLSVRGQSMISGNQQGGARFGERSYAIVSDRYLNFSSRVAIMTPFWTPGAAARSAKTISVLNLRAARQGTCSGSGAGAASI